MNDRSPDSRRWNPTPLLLAFGLSAFVLAGLSIADVFVPRPYDGIVPRGEVKGRLVVAEVIPGSAAHRAGLEAGDEILGIAREGVSSAERAAKILNRLRIGEQTPYLVKRRGGTEEVTLRLGRRQLGGGAYFYTTMLGFSFFLLGIFVLVRQPTLRASQVFFLLCGLFMLFLVCRMRPASYSGIDSVILGIGTGALLLLPAAFLHFYLLFPRPAWLRAVRARQSGRLASVFWRRGWQALYVVPPAVFVAAFLYERRAGRELAEIHGAPLVSWWLTALFLALGLVALRLNARHLEGARERRGVALVLIGSLFGLAPFAAASLLFAQHSTSFFVVGVMPLLLVPVTFTYAIVRFQLLDIRVILRRSLLYTVTTALVTAIYAGAIATFNAVFRGSDLATSPYFPIFLALAIVLLFEPVRRRVQEVIDRYFFAGRSRLEQALVELGEAMTAQDDLQAVVGELVERLPEILGLEFAALYLRRGERFERLAGPDELPERMPVVRELERRLERRGRLTRIDQLGTLALLSSEVARLLEDLERAGVGSLAALSSRRRLLGLVMLARREQMPLEDEEIELVDRLLHQAALALETQLLLEERALKAELEREVEIAAAIQAQLLPDRLSSPDGWSVAACCRPARIVGGDFYAQLPSPEDGHQAVVFGDVSGKSVSGALMMMAAHEALYALALTRPQPSELFALTNRRLYELGKRSFVALGYFAVGGDRRRLRYLVAGQPAPILRRRRGEVRELPLADHRIPIGALSHGRYRELEIELEPGDLVLGYSDGISETRAPDGEFFGEERLMRAVAAAPADAELLLEAVLEEIDRFAAGSLQYDDLTLVAVGRQAE